MTSFSTFDAFYMNTGAHEPSQQDILCITLKLIFMYNACRLLAVVNIFMVNLRFYELITQQLQQIPVWYAPDTYETIVVIGEFAVVNCTLFFAIANMVACSHVMTA